MPTNDFNLLDSYKVFLGTIDGSPRKYVRVDLKKLRVAELTAREKKAMDTYKETVGCWPPIDYDTVEITVCPNEEQKLTVRIDLKRFQYLRFDQNDQFDVIPLSKIAQIVQKDLILLPK